MFMGMLLLLELGRRIGNRRLTADPVGARAGVGAMAGAVFALPGTGEHEVRVDAAG